MSDLQVTCITKESRSSSYEGITHLGGSGWRYTTAQVIAAIEAGTHTFYTNSDGRRADIKVVRGPHGKYLRTYRNGQESDNLLSLNEC